MSSRNCSTSQPNRKAAHLGSSSANVAICGRRFSSFSNRSISSSCLCKCSRIASFLQDWGLVSLAVNALYYSDCTTILTFKQGYIQAVVVHYGNVKDSIWISEYIEFIFAIYCLHKHSIKSPIFLCFVSIFIQTMFPIVSHKINIT